MKYMFKRISAIFASAIMLMVAEQSVAQTIEIPTNTMGDSQTLYSVWVEGNLDDPQPTNGWISYFDGRYNDHVAPDKQTRVFDIQTDGRGVGYYLCKRGGAVDAQLTYGEKSEAPLTLPAGEVNLTIYWTKWQDASGIIEYALLNKLTHEVVALDTVSTEVNTQSFGQHITEMASHTFSPIIEQAGDYVLRISSVTYDHVWWGSIFYGFEVRTNGWTIAHSSANNGSQFHVNTWSTEDDGSGMKTPFLEYWHYNDAKLVPAVTSYTVTGLEPGAAYEFSALVRAYNEGGIPTGTGDARLYAGTALSQGIRTGQELLYGTNTRGYFATLSVVGTANAAGNLTVGMQVDANAFNWVAMKNAKLEKTTLPAQDNTIFARITSVDNFVDNRYLVVCQDRATATQGSMLAARKIDGRNYINAGSTPSATVEGTPVTINSNTISAPSYNAFLVRKSATANSFDFYVENYGLQFSTGNKVTGISLCKDRTGTPMSLVTNTNGDGFSMIRSNSTNFKLAYQNGNFVVQNTATKVYLYERLSLKYSAAEYSANVSEPGEQHDAPTLYNPAQMNITYTSSNPAVATVNAQGVVTTTGMGGVAIITASGTKHGVTMTTSYTLKVEKPAFPFSMEGCTVLVEETGRVAWYLGGREDGYFISSDPSIVEVNRQTGEVYGRQAGEAIVTIVFPETNAYRETRVSVTVQVRKHQRQIQFGLSAPALYVNRGVQYGYGGVGDNQEVTFSSSDPALATIDTEKGVAVGHKPGTVTLTATAVENYKFYGSTASVTVEVLRNETFFSFWTSPVVVLGQTTQTGYSKYEGDPRTPVYTSSDPSIASIDANGVIRGLRVGRVTITARLPESDEYTENVQSYEVEVIPGAGLVIPEVSTDVEVITLQIGQKYPLLIKTNSDGMIIFSSEDSSIADIDAAGIITGVSEGVTTIGYKVQVSSTYAASDWHYVEVHVKPNGVVKKNPTIEVTPNPVSLSIGDTVEVTVRLVDYDGQCFGDVSDQSAYAQLLAPEKSADNKTYVYKVVGLNATTTNATLKFRFDETDNFNKQTISVPVTVKAQYRYELRLKKAPDHGVSVNILGSTYKAATVFYVKNQNILTSDVAVASIPGYTSSVLINNATELNGVSTSRFVEVTYDVRQPQRGTFVRLKNKVLNKYAVVPGRNGVALSFGMEGMGSIFYYDGQGHLLSYQNGQYVKNACQMASVEDASQASSFTFQLVNDDVDYFTIQSDDHKYLYAAFSQSNGDFVVGASSSAGEYGYWHIQTLETLPITLNPAGYGFGTFYCPVAVDVPDGADAYYVSEKVSTYGPVDESSGTTGTTNVEYRLVLSKVSSVIPARTPAILVGTEGMTYECALHYEMASSGRGARAVPSKGVLVGDSASQVTASLEKVGGAYVNTVYALQPHSWEDKVGFYPWRSTDEGHGYTAGFKCYFVEDRLQAPGAGYYRLCFDDELSTGIASEYITSESPAAVYNLQGQCVGDKLEDLPSGIYIQGGRKVVRP